MSWLFRKVDCSAAASALPPPVYLTRGPEWKPQSERATSLPQTFPRFPISPRFEARGLTVARILDAAHPLPFGRLGHGAPLTPAHSLPAAPASRGCCSRPAVLCLQPVGLLLPRVEGSSSGKLPGWLPSLHFQVLLKCHFAVKLYQIIFSVSSPASSRPPQTHTLSRLYSFYYC